MTERSILRTDNNFAYLNIGSGAHGVPSFRLWVSDKLINNEIVEFPVSGRIYTTEKGNFVLRPDREIVTFDILISCGYRGRSQIEIGDGDECHLIYYNYKSQLGSLGISTGALISTRKEVEIKWSRTGRLYGKDSHGRCKLIPKEKRVIRLVDDSDPELCDLLKE